LHGRCRAADATTIHGGEQIYPPGSENLGHPPKNLGHPPDLQSRCLPAWPGAHDFSAGSQGAVHGFGIGEQFGHVRIENDHVRPGGVPGRVLAANAAAKTVERQSMSGQGFNLVQRLPMIDEYQALRRAVGWAEVEGQAVAAGLANSLYSVCVPREGAVVGCGRVVVCDGDGHDIFRAAVCDGDG